MKIGCLQFAPQLGDVTNNMNRADAVLSRSNQDLDLLVLPEMAFSGYSFPSLDQISPYLEPTISGVTSLWARATAMRYNCVVSVGYPEKVESENWQYYNSALVVNRFGQTVANYRKTFLHPTDQIWALEGPDEFFEGTISGLGYTAMGISMDINPYKFESPWNAWEFAKYVLLRQPNLVILSMAWITHQDYGSYSQKPTSPDLSTLSHWVARFEPLIRAENQGEVIVVIANRAGTEGDTVYTGTSCVLGIEDGEVKVYGILGRGQKELLVVDTENPPQFKLVADTGVPIEEDKAQSRKAPRLDTERLLPLRNRNPDTPYPAEHHPGQFEAPSGEIMAVSPVEPLSSHTFFPTSPSKSHTSITSSEDTITPIASTVSSPISFLGQPISPVSATEGRSPSEISLTSQERLEKMLHIASIFDRHSEPRSASTPGSASSMLVNTWWNHSPRTIVPSHLINVIPPSPIIEVDTRQNFDTILSPIPCQPTNQNHALVSPYHQNRGRRTSKLSESMTAASIAKYSCTPLLKAPKLPRSRSSSRTRPVQSQPTIAYPNITVETARAGVIVPVGAIQLCNSKFSSINPHAGMAACRTRSLSPPPTPATALWVEGNASWRESHLW